MSCKEVTALRKSGQLEEALNMARADIARNRDKWSCIALFWCLSELSKSASSEELPALAEEMHDLIRDIGEDEMIAKRMAIIDKLLIPHSREVIQANKDAKTPALAARAYNICHIFYERGELHHSLFETFGWIIYYALKADSSKDIEYRKGLLDTYLQLNLDRPSRLHSCILREAVRVEKDSPEQFMFSEFIDKWDLTNLQPEDWEKYESDDKKLFMSSVEKMIYVYTREVCAVESVHPSEKFMSVLGQAINKWDKDDNLRRCKALILAKGHHNDEAIAVYKEVIRLTNGQKFYLWNELADLTTDSDLKIALLSKAPMLHTPEKFVVKIRVQLAQLLYNKGLYANALYEANKAKCTYEANGWKIPSQVTDIMRSMPADTQPTDNTKQYCEWASKADEYIYSDCPSVQMVKVSQNEKTIVTQDQKTKKVIWWTLIDEHGEKIHIKPLKFHLPRTGNGACFDVVMQDNSVINIKPIPGENISWRKVVHGIVKIRKDKNNNPYTIIDGVYVGRKLLESIADGSAVDCVAICGRNDKWQGIAIFAKDL